MAGPGEVDGAGGVESFLRVPVGCDATGHAFLHAIPVNLPPDRHVARDGLPVAELCAGTVITAERLRHFAHLSALRGHHAQAALAASWQRTAKPPPSPATAAN